MSKIIEKFTQYLERLDRSIIPTTDSLKQFQENWRNKFIATIIGKQLNTIEAHKNAIGKDVFMYLKEDRFSYAFEYSDTDIFNKTHTEPVILTQEMYDVFEKAALKFWVKFYSRQLISCNITSNSTDKFTNLVFEWKLEETQKLISFYKELLRTL